MRNSTITAARLLHETHGTLRKAAKHVGMSHGVLGFMVKGSHRDVGKEAERQFREYMGLSNYRTPYKPRLTATKETKALLREMGVNVDTVTDYYAKEKGYR